MNQPRLPATSKPRLFATTTALPTFAVLDALAALADAEALFEELPSADSVEVADALLAAEEEDDAAAALEEEAAPLFDVTDAVELLEGVVTRVTVLLEGAEMMLVVVLSAAVVVEVETDVDVDVAAAELAELESCSQMPFETSCVFKASSAEHAPTTQPVTLSVSSEALAHWHVWSVTVQPTCGAPVSKQEMAQLGMSLVV